MSGYSGNEDDTAFGREHPGNIQISGYQDGRGFGRGSLSEYGARGGGVPSRRRSNTSQGSTGNRQTPNTINEADDYPMEASYSSAYPQQPTQFTGPEPIIHNEAEFDEYIKRNRTGLPHNYQEGSHLTGSYYLEGESTGTKPQSAYLLTLEPLRFEMPNHPSYHGKLDSKEAEGRLSMASALSSEGSCYLTRYSNNKESYVVSAIILHNGSRTPVHIKLNINTEKGCHSLEGTQKVFRTLDELLCYFERNPLSPDIRRIGSPCLPPDQYQHTTPKRSSTGMTKESPDTNQLTMIREMQKDFLDVLSKQNEDHKKELEEERQLFKEQIEKERQDHKELLETHKKEEAKVEENPAQVDQPLEPEPQPQKKAAEKEKKAAEKEKKTDCTLL